MPELGKRQQFVAFFGEIAVGIFIITLTDDQPSSIEPRISNVSGLVFNPYRRLGIGALSLRTKLLVANEQFGGQAWTRVRRENIPSQNLVRTAGFQYYGEDDKGLLYIFK